MTQTENIEAFTVCVVVVIAIIIINYSLCFFHHFPKKYCLFYHSFIH